MNNQIGGSGIFQKDKKIKDIPVFNWNFVRGCVFYKKECKIKDCWAASQCRRWAYGWADKEFDPVYGNTKPKQDQVDKLRNFEQQWFDSQYYKFFPDKKSIILVGWQSDIAGWSTHWKEMVIERIIGSNEIRKSAGKKPHVFLFLTKFPNKAYDISMPSNCWQGATVMNQEMEFALSPWRESKYNKKYLFMEPLREYVIVNNKDAFSWIVVGGGDGHAVSPFLFSQLDTDFPAHIPLYFKQYDNKKPYPRNGEYNEIPEEWSES